MRGKLHNHPQRRNRSGITPADAGKTGISRVCDSQGRDHPRGCGENGQSSARLSRQTGSPPRMRGKLVEDALNSGSLGITPADAGKTAPTERTRRNTWDHPRGCGENLKSRGQLLALLGSPPRMRGKLIVISAAKFTFRITPADAGKTENISKM